MVAADLVPGCYYLDTHIQASGVEGISRFYPLARIRVKTGLNRFWVKAAVLNNPPHDLLLGRDHKLLIPLIRNVLPEDPLVTEIEIVPEIETEGTKQEVDINPVITRPEQRSSNSKVKKQKT